jgi:hypothetical protein
MDNGDMSKEFQNFEFEIKSGKIKDILYKQDTEMESLIRLDFLKEKYGEDRIESIMKEDNIEISNLSDQEEFVKICKIAESNI